MYALGVGRSLREERRTFPPEFAKDALVITGRESQGTQTSYCRLSGRVPVLRVLL
jgi:hypothetical protein